MNMMDSVEAEFLAGFDMDEMRALEDGDLSLFSSISDAAAYRLQTDLSMMHSSNPSYKQMNDGKLNVLVEDDDDPQDPHHSTTTGSPPNSTNSASSTDGYNDPPANPAPAVNNNVKPNTQQPLQSPDDAPAPPPLIVCPIEVGKTSITLQKNQLCACKECGKLFKSIWYLKQHAVRHSNERPFKCNYCQKAFKFRSNLYQHNCPERVRQRGPNAPIRGMPGGPANGGSTPNSNAKKRFYTRGVGYTEIYDQPAMDQSLMNNNMMEMQMGQQPPLMYDMPFPPQENPLPMQMNEFGYNMNQFDVKTEPVEAPVQSQSFEEPQGFVHDVNSVHTKPLDPEYIDQYLQKNKHRIYTCKKCKLNFPHREYLQRHMAYHNDLDNRPYGCAQCPQRFHSPKQLESHQQKHAEDSPHRCQQCGGGFRSALALRRHKDQSRQCYCPPFGVYPQLMASPNAPLDQYAFIDSDNEADDDSVKGLGLNRQKSTTDSGMGSDSSTHSFTTSPVSARNTGLDEDLEHQFNPPQHYPMAAPDSKEEEGFRSRLNSATTQSCSPGSSFSGDSANSPGQRKFSSGMHGAGAEFGYNLNFQYQQSAQHHASMGYQYQQGAQHQHNVGNVQYNANFSENLALNGNMTAKENFQNLMTKNMTSSMGNSVNLTANVPVSSVDEIFSADDSENPRRAVLFEQIQTKVLAGKSELMLENFDSEFGIEADDDERMPQEKFSSDIVVADPEDLVEMEINKCIRTFLTLFLSTAIDVSRSKSQ